jgi:hypothetical protein
VYVSGVPRARSLSPAESARVRAAVVKLMEQHSSQGSLARLLKTPDGELMSQGSVSACLRGLPVGVTFARTVALTLNMKFEDLIGGTLGEPDGVQRQQDLPGWAEGAEEVLRQELLPHYVVIAASQSLVSFRPRTCDAAYVYDQGMLWLKYAPLEVRKQAEHDDILAARAADEAADDERWGKLDASAPLSKGTEGRREAGMALETGSEGQRR